MEREVTRQASEDRWDRGAGRLLSLLLVGNLYQTQSVASLPGEILHVNHYDLWLHDGRWVLYRMDSHLKRTILKVQILGMVQLQYWQANNFGNIDKILLGNITKIFFCTSNGNIS